jgi:hypothetical protein
VVSCFLRERLPDERNGEKQPAKWETPPLFSVLVNDKELLGEEGTYRIGVFPWPRQAVVDGSEPD